MAATVFDRMTMPPCATLLGWRLLDTLPRDDLLRLSERTWNAHRATGTA